MKDLAELRTQINSIDQRILELFVQRMDVSADIAAYKESVGKPVYDPTRERENIRRAADLVPQDLSSSAVTLQTVLMEASRQAQYRHMHQQSGLSKRLTTALANQPSVFPLTSHVACQGVEGAYQQIAVDRLFHHPQIDFYGSFDEVFEAVERDACDFGVIPLENSTAGSVTRVYDLMAEHNTSIVRTCRLKIEHSLLVTPGTKLEDVREVYSHEQAIRQCAGYLSRLPECHVHICDNTAMAAEKVASLDSHDAAAIASRDCASIYGLEIAERNIQDQSNNYTRFACISKELTIYPGADRSSLMIVTTNEPGALFKVLARFFALDINLIKLESRPIPDRDFEFKFYFDIECPAASPQFERLLSSLDDVCEECRYLGSYSEVI